MNKSIMGLLIWLVLVTGLVAAQTGGKLTLSLQPSLDGDGSIKATSITKAELLGTDGTVVKTATIIGVNAQFDLSGVAAGDYFIRVNGLADDLVPTRIDDPTKDINQFVGQKLRVTVTGSLSDPTYRIKTFSKGQGEQPVVGYSDGATLTPERYAYVILSLKTSPQKLEIRVLGTAYQLNSYTPSMATHPNVSTAINPPSSGWMLNSETPHHGDIYNGTASNCNVCHINMDTKPASFSLVSNTNGWCYRCHNGKGGDGSGFIDTAAALAAATPTVTATTAATTAAPTATPSTPAFEGILAISALLVVILVRRR